MQLLDATLRPALEQSVLDAWNPESLHPDAVRTEQNAANLPSVRIELQDFQSQASGGAASSRDAILPHTYEITGTWPYPTTPGATVNQEQILRWNELVAVLTASYPLYAGWRYSEEIGGGFADNAEEQTYSVSVTFTLLVVTSVRT